TSAMLHLAPGLVRPLADAGPGRARASRLRGVREGWAWAPRRWTQVTADTGIGDPSKSTAAKGAAYVDAAVERVAGFLVELAALPLDDLYE
ncbi:MAG TPA: creatininase family protein, partial [Gemmatimonadaceae bacterium]|nr:creatininase family protein [Gemmatimonadaceae bacterium]